MEWQPIESAPKDGCFIIGYEPEHEDAYPAWYCTAFRRWETPDCNFSMEKCVNKDSYTFECNPTHWMPLPEPPKE